MVSRKRINTKKVEDKTCLHKQTIWRKYTAKPPQFPQPHYVGAFRYWYENEIDDWLDESAQDAPTHNNVAGV